jgi:EAL domain-containing protein (putative c-di-GMP-specific phosphodiesterase class I)
MAAAEQTKAAGAAQTMLARLAAIAFCRADVVMQMGDDYKITFAIGTAQGVFGCSPENLIGKTFFSLFQRDDSKFLRDLIGNSDPNARLEDVLARAVSADKPVDVAVSGYRVPDFDNNFFIAVKVNPKKLVKVGRRDIDRDAGSGLLKKDAFIDQAADRISAYQAAGGKPKVSMVNLAGFEGDDHEKSALMAVLGETLRENSLGGDTAGLVDDENFSVVHGDETDAESLSQKVSNAVKTVGGISLMPRISTIDASEPQMSPQQMAKALMVSLDAFSKGDDIPDGGNLNAIVEKKLQDNVKAIERFRHICTAGHFDLVYMPVCRLSDGSIHHFEALTRFRDDAGESPFRLITLAEEVGIIPEFDIAVAQRAVEQISRYTADSRCTPIAANISGHSISDPTFCDELAQVLDRDLDLYKWLSLEITESAQIEDLEGVNASIQRFRRMGFKVALDDFGAGAASFDYLNSFDVDEVKFDGPVVQRASKTKKGKAFLKSMATLCAEIRVHTIAEMVEDEPLAAFLKQCGVHLGQGWYFGKPNSDMASFPEILPAAQPAPPSPAPEEPAAKADDSHWLSPLQAPS